MTVPVSLSQYIKKRTGVAMGAKGSMRNMLKRSFGAPSFYIFWRYWNPIWSYYLSRYVMKPTAAFLPNWCAVLVTFAVSGALHDLAVVLIKWQGVFFFTPWFTLMAMCALLSRELRLPLRQMHYLIKAVVNFIYIIGSFYITGLLF